ncbi:hypothetical protein [Nitrosovibrio sp. Nv6]|uniref:hypothetical protein n=1 Tax=Nitrosovibrio sp. Nv6 TaxID=1855340 RepID=UPI0008D309C1|nr:hypothetical protein [Nitrosovibrio sp. Nv6]SEP35568.1 hypothetical protein SAMN05216316_2555 [Nitrosovibrio sp. Nv6]
MLQTRPLAHSVFPISLLFGVFAIFVGLLCAVLPLAAALLMAAAVGAVVVFIAPIRWVTTLELILATVIAGAVEYFLGIAQANWVPYLLALLLGLRALMERKTPHEKKIAATIRSPRPWFILPLIMYFLTILASVGFNLSPLAQLVVGLKNYVFMFGLFLAFLAVRPFDTTTALVWKALIIVACVQLPVVLYQKFFIASGLSNVGGAAGLSWDAISGTFGGSLLGGRSAAMALFVIMAVVVSLVAWRNRKISLSRLQLICLLVLPSLILAEVKAAIVWLLFSGTLVFSRQIRTRPLGFLVAVLMLLTVAVGIAAAYKAMYYDGGNRSGGYAELYDKQITYFFDPDLFNAGTRELGRTASIIFWWDQHDISDPVRMIVGHGLGASRGNSSFAVGEVAKLYDFLIDTSTVTTLLWDLGLLGLVSFIGVLFLGAIESFRLARRKDLPLELQSSIECAGIGLLLILSGLIYNRDALDASAVQFLIYFFLAILARAKAYGIRSPAA